MLQKDISRKTGKTLSSISELRSLCAAGAARRKQASTLISIATQGIACLAKSMQEKPKTHTAYRLAFRMGFFSAAGFFFPEALPSEGWPVLFGIVGGGSAYLEIIK